MEKKITSKAELMPHDNRISMSQPHENRFARAVKEKK